MVGVSAKAVHSVSDLDMGVSGWTAWDSGVIGIDRYASEGMPRIQFFGQRSLAVRRCSPQPITRRLLTWIYRP